MTYESYHLDDFRITDVPILETVVVGMVMSGGVDGSDDGTNESCYLTKVFECLSCK